MHFGYDAKLTGGNTSISALEPDAPFGWTYTRLNPGYEYGSYPVTINLPAGSWMVSGAVRVRKDKDNPGAAAPAGVLAQYEVWDLDNSVVSERTVHTEVFAETPQSLDVFNTVALPVMFLDLSSERNVVLHLNAQGDEADATVQCTGSIYAIRIGA